MLARWLIEISQDKSSTALERLATSPDFGVLYLHMRQLGEQLRQEAIAAMTGGRYLDPRNSPQVARSALLAAAGRTVLGVDMFQESLIPATTPEEVLFAGSHPPYAWIETFGRDMHLRVPRPVVHIATVADHLRELMLWDIACVFARFVKDLEMYKSGLPDFIYPPDAHTEKSLTPLLHAFARGLLNYGNDCPPQAGCSCIALQFEMSRVPEGLLPQPTQPISTQALRQEMQRQTTPPNGVRWQAWREQQLKKTDQELRGFTPPPESGDL